MSKPKMVQRHKVVAFYGVPTTENGTTTIVYHKMKKFTQFSKSENPIEYSRQYVDEPFQQTDVTGYSPSISYAFDKHTNLPVLKDIIDITDEELIGDDAVRSIVVLDLSAENPKVYRRDYSVIPNSEGDNINVYTYSGTLKVHGEKIEVEVATNDDYQTITVTDKT